MAYLISVFILLLSFGLAVFTSGYALWYLMPPVILLTVPASLALGIGATSVQAAKNAIGLSFSESTEHSQPAIQLAIRFLRVTGNQFLLVASIAVVLSVFQVLMMVAERPEILEEASRFNRYAMALLPLFYGVIFKSLFYSAEQKLIGRYI